MTDHAVFSAQGLRNHMEDTYAVDADDERVVGAVFDGHCGDGVAKLARDRFLAYAELQTISPAARLNGALRTLQMRITDEQISGGACVAAFYADRGQDNPKITVSWLGDSRVVYVNKLGTAVSMTFDHRFGNWKEQGRVLGANGFFNPPYFGHPSVGWLIPTRSLGDDAFEKVGLSHEPEIVETIFFDHGWVIAATDGLWDVVKVDDALGELIGPIESADDVVRTLGELAFDRRTQDNVTILAAKV